MLGNIFDSVVKASPVSVIMRAMLEYVLCPQRLDAIFATHAQVQYQRELLFSRLVNLLS